MLLLVIFVVVLLVVMEVTRLYLAGMLESGDGGVRCCLCGGHQAYLLMMLVVSDLRCCLGDLRCCLGGGQGGRQVRLIVVMVVLVVDLLVDVLGC